jgi:hypothetical protein
MRVVLGLTLTCFFAATALAQQPTDAPIEELTGRWLAGRTDEGFQVVLDFDSDPPSLHPFQQPMGAESIHYPITIVPLGGGMFALSIDVPGDGRAMHLLQDEPNHAILRTEQEEKLAEAWRRGDPPAALLGDWEVYNPADPTSPGTVSIGEAFVAPSVGLPVLSGGETIGLGAEGAVYHIGVVFMGSAVLVLDFVPAPDGTFLVRRNGDSTYVMLYRPGARPGWLPEP